MAQGWSLLRIETGSLYPALHHLEKREWLRFDWALSEPNQRANTG
jgi:PadR family transcriptional regulator, regulatory protein PadR